jgi:peroxiredoxin
MIDTRIAPTGSQGQWEIMRRDNYQTVGHIQQAGKKFNRVPISNTILSDVSAGPYSSKDEAVSAIPLHTNGICSAIGS